ncbi:MAG: hypothetical protein ABSH34_25465 [Verrucomicrobiota bacterium]|jgi:hypothetical protein
MLSSSSATETFTHGVFLTHSAKDIRAAAQLLSSPRVDPQRLARLAKMERVEPVLH